MDFENENIKIVDIAKKAGVSITAVSFAINGKPGISAKTRDRILKIVKEYGYISKPIIRVKDRSAEKQTKTIMLLNCSRTSITSNDFSKAPFFTELLKVLEKKSSEHGFRFWVKSVNVDASFYNNINEILVDENIDNIILIATDIREQDAQYILKAQSNIVAIDAIFDSLDMNCIVMDNYLGATLAAKHLLDCGYKKIGYVQSTERIYNFEMRKKGFFETLKSNGVIIDSKNIFQVNGNTIDISFTSLYESLKVNTSELPTAFFAENDYMAIGLIKALQAMGISIPGRVAVIGFDDIEIASFVTPDLTTIHVPVEKIADLAIKILIKMIDKKKQINVKQLVSVNLIKRTSTKKAHQQ